MKISKCLTRTLAVFPCVAALTTFGATFHLDEIDFAGMSAGWGKAQKNRSITGQPLRVGQQSFEHGVGTHADSECTLDLDGKARVFHAFVGVDDDAGNAAASIEFVVNGDERELWRSGVCRWSEKPRECRVDLTGIHSLELVVTDAGDGNGFDHADWADATIEYDGAAPAVVIPQSVNEEPVVLTPVPSDAPHLNNARVCAVRPGSPFLYRIPCTGKRPIEFTAKHLPPGIDLDPETGIFSGAVERPGRYRTTILARSSARASSREFTLVVGDTLALTPPMGWNSWYIHYDRVSDALMRQSADQMIASGMADFGYQYVNIDDCWMKKQGDEPYRDAAGAVLPNAKFPDMRALADYIHSKGLRAGLYTSPGPWTCGGYVGAYQHEALDAHKFAEWGFDFLKYDWCSYSDVAGGNGPAELKRPYQLMWGELQKLKRDVVFNLCQYGMGEVWKWGGDVGHCWRTTGDLGLEGSSRLPGFYKIGFSNAQHWQNARPGAWNDPDYILVGWVGDARGMGQGTPTSLTPNEQYSYMSMWSLMAAPLIFSGDMAKLDPFTLNILCNSEVIDVDQDVLGQQARIVRQTRNEFVLAKDLADGSKAVGLFNLASAPRKIRVTWSDLGLTGPQTLHDLWRQRDAGIFADAYGVEIPRHGVAMFRLEPARNAK